MKTFMLIVIAVLVTISQAGVIKNRCAPLFLNPDNVAFDFNQVYPSDSNKPANLTTPELQAEFLLCQGVSPSLANPLWNCDTKPDQNMAFILQNGVCYPTTTQDSTLTTTLLKDGDEKVNGVQLEYNNDKVPVNTKAKLYPKALRVIISCNKDVRSQDAIWSIDNTDANFITFKTSNSAGCGTSMTDFFNFVEKYKYIFGTLFFFLGILFCFFGRRFFTVSLVILGFLLGFMAVVGTAYLFSAMQNADSTKVLVLIGLGVFLGCGVAWVFYTFKVITTMAAVGTLFFFIGNAVIRLYLSNTITDTTVQYVIIAALVMAGVIFGYFYSKHCITFATSFGGAFLIVYSIGTLTNTLDTPKVIAQKIKRGEKEVWNLVYGGIWLGLGIAGLIVQYLRNKQHPEDDEEAASIKNDDYYKNV